MRGESFRNTIRDKKCPKFLSEICPKWDKKVSEILTSVSMTAQTYLISNCLIFLAFVHFSSSDNLCGSHEGTCSWDGSKFWQATVLVGDCSTWTYWRYAAHKIRNPQDSSKSSAGFMLCSSLSLFNSYFNASLQRNVAWRVSGWNNGFTKKSLKWSNLYIFKQEAEGWHGMWRFKPKAW